VSAQISNDAAVAIRVPGVRTLHSIPLIPLDCTGAGPGKTMMPGMAEDGVEEGGISPHQEHMALFVHGACTEDGRDPLIRGACLFRTDSRYFTVCGRIGALQRPWLQSD
jgi:hypothetical protein